MQKKLDSGKRKACARHQSGGVEGGVRTRIWGKEQGAGWIEVAQQGPPWGEGRLGRNPVFVPKPLSNPRGDDRRGGRNAALAVHPFARLLSAAAPTPSKGSKPQPLNPELEPPHTQPLARDGARGGAGTSRPTLRRSSTSEAGERPPGRRRARARAARGALVSDFEPDLPPCAPKNPAKPSRALVAGNIPCKRIPGPVRPGIHQRPKPGLEFVHNASPGAGRCPRRGGGGGGAGGGGGGGRTPRPPPPKGKGRPRLPRPTLSVHPAARRSRVREDMQPYRDCRSGRMRPAAGGAQAAQRVGPDRRALSSARGGVGAGWSYGREPRRPGGRAQGPGRRLAKGE
jgi:hypothetical protein